MQILACLAITPAQFVHDTEDAGLIARHHDGRVVIQVVLHLDKLLCRGIDIGGKGRCDLFGDLLLDCDSS